MKIQITLAVILFILFSGATQSINAQSETIQLDKKSFHELVYIEADPFAYINKGYSIHLGYENWGMRFDLTKVSVDFPEAFEDAFYSTKAFDLKTKITGVKLDYIGNRTNWTRGAFVGLDINTQKLNFRHRASDVVKDLVTFNVGVRAGYKFSIWKGLYVTPWAAVWRNVKSEESFAVGNDVVATNKWDWITTLHIGYAVDLGQ